VLSHPLRREILLILSEKEECSFTDLTNALNVDTGKLSFHLRNLEAFLEQTSTGKYRLSKVGKNAIILIKDLEAWAIEADIVRKITSLPIANFKRRVLAFLIDFAIALVFFMALPSLFSLLLSGGASIQYIDFVLFLIVFWIYLTLLEGFSGQTLGKRIIGLKVLRIDGKKLSYDQTAVRNFGAVFLLPFDLFFGFRLKDKRFMRYFEKFSGTIVIDLKQQFPHDTTDQQ
jgi:uncharacterized RDD family membrane protein YckC